MDLTQLPETVAQTIDAMAMKLSVPAEKLLELATYGVRVEGAGIFVLCSLGLILTAWITHRAFEYFKAQETVEPEAMLCVVLLVPWILLPLGIYRGIIMCFVPAYWVLKQILNI